MPAAANRIRISVSFFIGVRNNFVKGKSFLLRRSGMAAALRFFNPGRPRPGQVREEKNMNLPRARNPSQNVYELVDLGKHA
ncbi:MAG: hypothetical protein MZV63_39190 [Marinilabiliales bacterium]|nr:hypothetical protein [Marinilabiliales bacterium]